MKKTSKILVALCIILMILSISVISFASEPKIQNLSGDTSTDTLLTQKLTGNDTNVNTKGMTDVGNQIVTIIRVVGTIASVVILLILGIKYMMGSAAEKAEYKKTMIPYLIGAILLFAASNIVGLINTMGKSVASNTTP